jgi:hypothetical protein
LLARGFELAALPADTARPRILAESIDHRPANPALRKRFKLDPARFVETLGGVDQADNTVLDEVTDIDRMGHGCCHAASKLFNERDARDHSRILIAGRQ